MSVTGAEQTTSADSTDVKFASSVRENPPRGLPGGFCAGGWGCDGGLWLRRVLVRWWHFQSF